jgi:O-antigen/teichoic acid export membrane protein
MLLGVVLARMLEPSVFGEFVAISATLMLMMIPVSFSTAQLLVNDSGKTRDLFTRALGMSLTVSFFKLLILTVFISFSLLAGNQKSAIVGAIAGLPLVLADCVNVLKSDLEGRGFFKPNFLVQVADLFANASVSITLVWNGWGIYGLAVGGLAGFIPQALLYVLISDRSLSVPKFRNLGFFRQFQTGFWLWLGSVASSWFLRIDKILLGHFGSPTQLGYYNRAMNYGPVSHILLNSLMTNATIRGLSTKESPKEKARFFLKIAAIVISAGVLNGIFWYFMAPSLVPWIFGKQWIGAIPAFQILSWLGVPYFLVYGSATILYAEKKFRVIAFVHCAGIITLIATFICTGINNFLKDTSACWLLLLCMFFTGGLMSTFSVISLFKFSK